MSQPRIAVRVSDIVEVTPLVKRFQLESLDGAPLPRFSGGAHVLVEMQDAGTVRRNAYSLMSPPSRTSSYMISVMRDESGRGGSCFLHDSIEKGAVLFISPPVNLFALDLRARKHLLVAGGIGVTPFVAMAEQLLDDGRAFELHYAVRSRERAAFADELAARFGGRTQIYHSKEGERIPLEQLLLHQPLGTHLYVCGPERMIDWALMLTEEFGWPSKSVHHERFVRPAVGTPFRLSLARSAVTVDVGSHQSMLEAIESAGVDASYLCRGGACGQCRTKVLARDGHLLHHDHFLSGEEHASGETVMPCVSRFEGAMLTLDL